MELEEYIFTDLQLKWFNTLVEEESNEVVCTVIQ